MTAEDSMRSANGFARTAYAHVQAGLRWWGRELLDLIPYEMRRRFAKLRILITVAGDQLRVHLPEPQPEGSVLVASKSDAESLAEPIRSRLGADQPEVIVAVPADRALMRKINFPLAAQSRLADVVRFQLPRINPIRDSEVYTCERIASVDAGAKSFAADVAIVRKQEIEALQELVSRLGLSCRHFVFSDDTAGDDDRLSLVLSAPPARRLKVEYALVLLALVLAASCVALSYRNAHEFNGKLSAAIQRVKPAAEKASAISRLNEAETALAREVIDAKSGARQPLDALEKLSEILGDDVRLSELRTSGASINIAGYARDATQLLSVIDATDEFSSAKFTAPTARDPATDLDRFSLSLNWEQRP